MRELLVLLRYSWLSWRQGQRQGRQWPLARLGFYGLAVFVLFNLALCWLGFHAVFSLVEPVFREVLLRLATNVLAAGVLVLVLINAVNADLGSLYEAPHLPILMTWPVRLGPLYTLGYLNMLAQCLAAAGALVFPAWIGLGLASGAGAGFIFSGLLGIIALTLFGSAFMGIVLSLVLSLVSAGRLRRLLIGAIVVGIVAVILLFEIMIMRVLDTGWEHAAGRLTSLAQRFAWLPHGLLAETALQTRTAPAGASLARLGALLGLGILFVLGNIFVGSRTYLTSWSRAQEAGTLRRRFISRLRAPGRTGAIWAMLGKDWQILLREPLFWANLLVYMLAMSFYAWTVSQNPQIAQNSMPAVRASHLFVIPFFATGWLAQAGAMAVSREGATWWALQTAPLSLKEVLWGKFLFGASGLLLFCLMALGVLIGVGMPLPPWWLCALLVAGIVAAVSGAGLLADLLLPDFSLRLDVRMSGAHSGGKIKILLAMVAGFGTTGLAGLAFFLSSFFLPPFFAALLVVGEGVLLLLLAGLIGGQLLRGVLSAD